MSSKQLASIERLNCLFAALASAVALLVFSRPVLWGVLLGSAVSCLNFYSIHKLVERAMGHGPARGRHLMQILLAVKMVALVVAVFLVLRFVPVQPVALAFGLSIFLFSIAVESIRFALRHPVSQ